MKNLLISFVFIYSAVVSANEAPTQSSTKMAVRYASSPWNKSSTEIDSAFMFMRDKSSGRIVKIVLDETEPDSSLFSGRFSINWSSPDALAPEVYIPPQNMRNDASAIKHFNSILQSGKIKAQPQIIRNEKSQQILEVYDTKEQAAQAQIAYDKELSATRNEDQAQLIKPQSDETALKVAQMAAHAARLALLAKEAAINETNRIRMEQLELQKLQQRRSEQDKLNKKQIAERKAKAKALSLKAVEFYQKSQFKEATELFEQAVELDPHDKGYYFMYGVSLYRLDKFDQALVTLKISGSNSETDLEKKYYIGLIHFRLKELAAARAAFAEVKLAKHATLSPSAAFYEGLVYFSEENLEPAQQSFEFVLDNSSDPALDKKAEEYIEKIANLIQFKKMAAKKIFLSATLGLNYDSNVLYAPENDSGSASTTDKGGLRANIAGDAEYRFFYKEASDLSAKLAIANTRSASTDFAQADPLTYTATLPYSLKGLINGKGTRLALTPGYESLFMDFDRSEQLSNILNTYMINADFMVVMKDDWFSNYTLDIRSDDSLLPGTTGTDTDADAIKISLVKSETFFVDSSKKRALIGNLGLVMNNAKGDEKKYNRIDFGAMFTAPWARFKNTTWNTGLAMYLQNYSDSAASRKDTNMSLSFGTSKAYSEAWTWSNNATYTSNTSNDAASDYSKYSIMSSIHYAWSK